MITLACPEHPKYRAVYPPRSTVRHSAGCESCWWLYNSRRYKLVTVVAMNKTGFPVMKIVR